jgi:hypothetical protein
MLIDRAKSAPSFAMMPFSRFYPASCLSMISSENRFPLFRIMLFGLEHDPEFRITL